MQYYQLFFVSRTYSVTLVTIFIPYYFFHLNNLYNNTGLYASWSLPSGVLRSYLGGTRFTYPSGRVLGHSLVPIRITARVIRRFQNNIFRRAMINMAKSLRVHSLIARAALHSRASAGCNFGQTAGPSLIKFGTREGGREAGRGGRGGDGREGRGGEGGRAGEGRGGEGRGGEGRGGEGRGLSTLPTNQNLCDRGA